MASAAKTSENFVGVDPAYAVYTNDVDKPLVPTKVEEADEDKTAGAKTTSRQTKK